MGIFELVDEKMEYPEFDERIFALLNPSYKGVIEALGVPLTDNPSSLVGVYFPWHSQSNAREFIQEMAGIYGETNFSTLDKNLPPGFVCKMHILHPSHKDILTEMQGYRRIKLSLLEIRANNPKPEISLSYDTQQKYWAYHPVMAIASALSNGKHLETTISK